MAKSLKSKSMRGGAGTKKSMKKVVKTVNTDREDVLCEFIQRMMGAHHVIKLYHWKTKSYATHKATDNLHSKLAELIDRYVEVFMGKLNYNLKMTEHSSISIKNLDSNEQLEKYICELIDFLTEVHKKVDLEKDTDVLNIRDEIVGEFNQFLYLLRLK
jgi:hypothetical protein